MQYSQTSLLKYGTTHKMQIVHFKSLPPLSPFAPHWDYFIGVSQFSQIDFELIAKEVLIKETEIKSSTKPIFGNDDRTSVLDGFTKLGEDSLTSRYMFFNVFKWKHQEVQDLLTLMRREYVGMLDDPATL